MKRYEYCQVTAKFNVVRMGTKYLREHSGIEANDGNKVIASGEYYLDVFNQLGQQGWHICGKSTIEYPEPQDESLDEIQDIFYFEREIE